MRAEAEEGERACGRGDAGGDHQAHAERMGDLGGVGRGREAGDTGMTASALSPAALAIALFTPDATLT